MADTPSPMSTDQTYPEADVILPNLNPRFSGITSTVSQVVPHQQKSLRLTSFGYRFPVELPHLTWVDLLRLTGRSNQYGRPRIFHARRNIEMCAGLLLKHLFRRQLHLIFTSEAQREHTWFTRFLYQRMDTLLSTSPRSASYLKQTPDAIVPHGVDTTAYFPAPNRAVAWKEGGLPGSRGIGIFGRVRPQKGLREYVNALCHVLPECPEYTAVVIGETTPAYAGFEQELRRHIHHNNLEHRFVWLGKRPFSEIPSWFQRMSLVVAVPHSEGFGLTCLEAMASGAPVVASRAGAFEMILREGIDGRLVPCRDWQSLANALRDLLSDPDQLETMGQAARERVCEEFTIEKEAETLNSIYRRMLGIPANTLEPTD